jgi:hypothetical protein
MNETEKQTSKNYNYSRAIKLIKYISNKKNSQEKNDQEEKTLFVL